LPHGPNDLIERLDRFANEFSGVGYESAEIQDFYSKKYWVFSDGIVVRWYRGSQAETVMTEFDAQLDQLSSIALAQGYIMWTDGQTSRGGIGSGWFLEQGTSVVGEALVSAARIQKRIENPFIGVEDFLYQHYLKHPGRDFYSKDADPTPTLFITPCEYTNQVPALDYFMAVLGNIDLSDAQIRQSRSIADEEERQEFLNKTHEENQKAYIAWHRDFVTIGLKHSVADVRKKFEALKQHHNFRVGGFRRVDDSLLIV